MPIKNRLFKVYFVFLLLIFAGSASAVRAADSFEILLIHDSTASATQKISYNVGRCLNDASVKFDLVDQTRLPQFHLADLKPYPALVFLSENSSKYVFGEDLLQYVQNGGIVCFAVQDFNPYLLPELGITTKDPQKIEFLDCKGIKSELPLIREQNLNVASDLFFTSALNLNFSSAWTTLLKYHEPDLVMLAVRKYGKGSIIFWNSSALSEKPFRGIFLFTLFRQFPLGVFSVFNAVMMHLDDSPPPAFGIKEGPVYRDLGMTDIQFHLNVWQKKVFAMLEEFGFLPTHFVCLSYDDQIKPPFSEKTDREPFFSKFLQEAKKLGHEFAFHGYNHQSLTLGKSPSKPWETAADMAASNKTAFKIWNSYKFAPTLSYVPPNNVIDKAGKQSLIDGFPTIRVVCRVYQDSGEYGGMLRSGYLIGAGNSEFSDKMMKNIFSMYASRRAKSGGSAFFAGDEFGSDPEVPQLLNLPRISSGYQLDGFSQLLILNGIMAHGIITHFFHPDDIYDPSRREATWEKTLMAMRRLFIFFEKNALHLRKILTSKFLQEFKRYLYSETEIFRKTPTELEIKPGQRRYYYLFSANGRPKLENARILSEIEADRLYLIEAENSSGLKIFVEPK